MPTMASRKRENPGISSSSRATYQHESSSPEKAKTLLDIFHKESHYPIFIKLCELLPIADIISLTRTCKQLSNLYQTLLPLQWNVNRTLERFVRDPSAFRSQLGRCDALVSGSVALQFFEKVIWQESDLDIYVENGSCTDDFSAYLIQEESYGLTGIKPSDGYDGGDMLEVRDFARWNGLLSIQTRIQLIVTASIPIQAILRSFYSTAVVNFLSWNKPYSMFPLPTFVNHKGYMLTEFNEHLAKSVNKYTRRGWRFQDALWPEEEKQTNHPIRSYRRPGDKYTWAIPLQTKIVHTSKTPDFVLEHAQFGLDLEQGRNDYSDGLPRTHHGIMADSLYALTLEHRYLFSECEWMMWLGHRMDRLTYLELKKLNLADQPPQMDDFKAFAAHPMRDLQGIKKPDTWSYWDSVSRNGNGSGKTPTQSHLRLHQEMQLYDVVITDRTPMC